ncbi:hypothetical protein STEG23_001286, partial [Scotinomys teguina]
NHIVPTGRQNTDISSPLLQPGPLCFTEGKSALRQRWIYESKKGLATSSFNIEERESSK